MSRIGKRVLTIPENVNVELENQILTVKGPKGELSLTLNPNIDVKVENIRWMDDGEKLNFSMNGDKLSVEFTGFYYGDDYCVRVAVGDIV